MATQGHRIRNCRDKLHILISELPAFRLGDGLVRVNFMSRAGLPSGWIAQYNWHLAPAIAAEQLLGETLRLGFPIIPAHPGYSALALVVDRIIEEDMVGRTDGLFLARVLVCWDLLKWKEAYISDRMQDLINASELEGWICYACPHKRS